MLPSIQASRPVWGAREWPGRQVKVATVEEKERETLPEGGEGGAWGAGLDKI